jgi:hypothetical protein
LGLNTVEKKDSTEKSHEKLWKNP